ncbi:MAG: hypothetical protein HUJ51_05190 [Eggerthellaceae bacterium]|nr:hypothetical protein [Eggerthellaceae bacterium]
MKLSFSIKMARALMSKMGHVLGFVLCFVIHGNPALSPVYDKMLRQTSCVSMALGLYFPC